MTTPPGSWHPPDSDGHTHRLVRAVLAVAEFVAPLVPEPWRRRIADWAGRFAVLAVFAAPFFS